MAKRMVFMLVVMLALLSSLGFVKFRQVSSAVQAASHFQPPPEAVTSIVAHQERWPATMSVIGTMEAVHGVTVSADLPGTVDPGRETFLRGLLQDRDPVVRRVAADLIEQKLQKPRPQYTPLPVDRTDYAQIAEWARQPHSATIHMTRGLIQIALLAQDAPITTWNFAQLSRDHVYDNTTFMRVVPNFVIQGGDPRNDMEGGPGYSIRDEINLQKYTRGAVGMALSGPDTGGSQFFITHSPQPHLDGGYTIFGRVTEGMNAVVDQTERGDRVETIAIDGERPSRPQSPGVTPGDSESRRAGRATAAGETPALHQ